MSPVEGFLGAHVRTYDVVSTEGRDLFRRTSRTGTEIMHTIALLLIFCGLFSGGCADRSTEAEMDLPYSPLRPHIIQLDLPPHYQGSGGLIAVDVNGDGKKDFIVTKPGHIAVYSSFGRKLWTEEVDIQVTVKSEEEGLPGLHGPGVKVADVDGDQQQEVIFLTRDNTLHIVQGTTGSLKKRLTLPHPQGAERWEHLVIADFRGLGDRDLLLQATNAEGYRMGRYLAAYTFEELMNNENPKPLWTRDDFVANAHSGARVADLDGDGREEVLGGTIVGPDGDLLFRIPLKGHIDSIFVADVRPDIPGLEVVALEEGGDTVPEYGNRLFRTLRRGFNHLFRESNRVFLYNGERLIWVNHYRQWEPQNAAVGNFDPGRSGLEIWCRSRFSHPQKPFVFDSRGRVISRYRLDDVAPQDWTGKGVDIISTIDWTGDSKQLAAAKERHKSGNVAVFDPIGGRFLHRFDGKADRLYVADVSGDWREELIVLSGNQLHIYENSDKNPNPDRQRLWTQNHYRRSKMTWNYYNP